MTRAPLALSVLVLSVAACRPAPPPAAPVYVRADDGPRLAPWLELTGEQRGEVLALVERVERALAPLEPAVEGLGHALVSALRRCRKDTPMLRMRADGVVRAGRAAREPVLDAIDDLHAILTPAQRRRLVHHLLERERRSTEEERQDATDEEAESVGLEIDLSWTQIGSILIRLRKIQSVYEDRTEPWIERYRRAVRAFAAPSFDVRDHAIAEAPVFRLAVDLVTDAYRVIVPLLEPEQCEALGDHLERELEQAEAREAHEARERR